MVNIVETHRRQSRSQEIFEALQEEIVSNKLKPGTPIDKAQLCERFNVSRTPVTDALSRLSERGLIDIFPQRGTFVSKIDLNDMLEHAFIRECIETGIVRHLTGNLSESQMGQLETNIRIQRALVESEDTDGFYRYDKEFHDLLLRFSGQHKAVDVLRPILTQLERVRKQIVPLIPRASDALREHKSILKAIKGSDPEKSANMMRQHLAESMATVDMVLSENPNLLFDATRSALI